MATRSTRKTRRHARFIEVLDTTLRDGEQAEGVSLVPAEKLTIASRLLREVKVDRIEVASARTSKGERVAVTNIINWAEAEGVTDRIEVLGFVDTNVSVDWARAVGVGGERGALAVRRPGWIGLGLDSGHSGSMDSGACVAEGLATGQYLEADALVLVTQPFQGLTERCA